MANDLELPYYTSSFWVFGIFLIASSSFHWLLVYKSPLTKSEWKQCDYLIIGLAVVGLSGAISASQQSFIPLLTERSESRLMLAIYGVQLNIDSAEIAACRKFIRNEFSPPAEKFDNLQKEFDSMCTWFKKTNVELSKLLKEKTFPINFKKYPPPVTNNQYFLEMIEKLEKAISNYHIEINNNNKVTKALVQPTELERIWKLISPTFIAIALALRMTKITGELRLK